MSRGCCAPCKGTHTAARMKQLQKPLALLDRKRLTNLLGVTYRTVVVGDSPPRALRELLWSQRRRLSLSLDANAGEHAPGHMSIFRLAEGSELTENLA
jgi:hypothetical protein